MGDTKRKQPTQKFIPHSKRAKKGNDGKWKTPHQTANLNARLGAGQAIECGDAGFWVTCQRGLERKAISEMMRVCDQLGEKLYGIKPPVNLEEEAILETQESEDIESAVKAELEGMKGAAKKPKTEHTFLPVRSDLDCVFFIKTRKPVDPLDFVLKICQEALSSDPMDRLLKHINRLTPVLSVGKSLDRGLEKTARETLAATFQLRPEAEEEKKEDGEEKGKEEEKDGSRTEKTGFPAYTYAIRPNIRSNKLGRTEVIDRVAAVVATSHKVNLGNPDKVILVDIFKNFCGMSVVDAAQWDRLRKYNINEIYKLADDKKESQLDTTKVSEEGPGQEKEKPANGGEAGAVAT